MRFPEQWTAVDDYFSDLLIPADNALDAALMESRRAELPAINVSACQGKMLMLLAKIKKAKKILEIGTLGGYSTIWLSRALPPGGKIITLELNPDHARVAKNNFATAGVSKKIELIEGRAVDSLAALHEEKRGPFDLIFIDADKPSTADYFNWSLKLSRPGTVIIVDNVVREGQVVDPKSEDAAVQGVRKFNATLAKQIGVEATAIQTVGVKGYDGFAMIYVG